MTNTLDRLIQLDAKYKDIPVSHTKEQTEAYNELTDAVRRKQFALLKVAKAAQELKVIVKSGDAELHGWVELEQALKQLDVTDWDNKNE